MDTDIAASYGSLATTEEKLGHKWGWSKAGADNKKDYFVPNFGMDGDVKDSLSHLKQEQAIHGTWDLPKDDWFWSRKRISKLLGEQLDSMVKTRDDMQKGCGPSDVRQV